MNITPLLLGLALAFYGCEGKSPTEPAIIVPTATVQATPTPVPTVTPTPLPAFLVVTAHVMDAVSGQTLMGAKLTYWSSAAPTDVRSFYTSLDLYQAWCWAGHWNVRVERNGYVPLLTSIDVVYPGGNFTFRLVKA